MTVDVAAHPADDLLAAFALGKTDEATTDRIGRHLEACKPCTDRVAARTSDSFVAKFRRNQSLLGTCDPAATDPTGKAADRPQLPASQTDLAPAGLPDLGETYEVRKELGRGGMGTVYLVHNKMMNRPEVVKVMNAEIAAKPGVAERFLTEIQAAGQLEHPNVVTAYSALRPGGGLALAMAFVDGLDLDKLVKANGPLSLLRACNYVAQAARGLEHAREAGLTHRDMKPSNLMATRVKNKTVVKVLDFGLAKFKSLDDETGLTHKGQMMGTPAYIAPEQAMDASKADTRADVYSLGCTLYFLIAGRAPFGGSVMEVLAAHAMAAPRPLPELRSEVPAELWEVISKMMAKNPVDRYQTPGDVEKALIPFIKPGAALVTPDGQPVAKQLTPQPVGDQSVLEYDPPFALPVVEMAAPPVARSARWLPVTLVAGLLIIVSGAAAALSGILVKVNTPDGMLIVEVNEPGADVVVDGGRVTVTANGERFEARVKPGSHTVEIRNGKSTFSGERKVSATVEGAKTTTLKAEVIPVVQLPGKSKPAEPVQDGKTVSPKKDTLQVGNIFKGFRDVKANKTHKDTTLEVTERTGNRFKARLEVQNLNAVSTHIVNGVIDKDLLSMQIDEYTDIKGSLQGNIMSFSGVSTEKKVHDYRLELSSSK